MAKIPRLYIVDGETRRVTRHHIVPTSRGRNNNPSNLVYLDENWHRCWHTVFGNLTLPEIQSFIKIIMDTPPNGVWTLPLLKELREAIKGGDRDKIHTVIVSAHRLHIFD